jgi:DNA-binding response OmpR family regulator
MTPTGGPWHALDAPPIVLIVEDDPETREMYRTALELGGLWATEVPDAAEAWTFAEDLRPDAILTDLGLPDLDGVELARRIRNGGRIAQTPIIAITGRDVRNMPAADRALFDDVLLKPVALDNLVGRVNDVLRERGVVLRARVEAASTPLKGSLEEPPSSSRPCPTCGHALTWVERRQLSGVTFDYYRTCGQGCGLACYDHARRRFVKLAG